VATPSAELNAEIMATAAKLGLPVNETRVHSSDVFYRDRFDIYKDIHQEHGCACVEMESFSLFHNAKVLNKRAACVLTISDSLVTHEATSSEERQNAFTNMMKLVLETIK
jgi:purine-nucleoside phosphorylase